MATYNKRGYKTPKVDVEGENAKDKDLHSTTVELFDSLDKGAFKTETWIAKNQKYIFGFIGGLALITASYLLYNKFVIEPKEEEAVNKMFQAQQSFKEAVDGFQSDSLFNLSLKGGQGRVGFLDIAAKYPRTKAANLAHYYAGMIYLNTNKFKEAISELDQFKSDDPIFASIVKGAMGDAFAQINQLDKALIYYGEAVEVNRNGFTTPYYLLKAGQTALSLNKKDKALEYFIDIKTNYETSPEASNIDALIGMSQQ